MIGDDEARELLALEGPSNVAAYGETAHLFEMPKGLTWDSETPPIWNAQRWTRTNHGALVPMPPVFLAWTGHKDAAGTVELRHTHDADWTRKQYSPRETKHGQRDPVPQ